jgi:hypothetical protein
MKLKILKLTVLCLWLSIGYLSAQNPQTDSPAPEWDITDPSDTSGYYIDSATVNAEMPYLIHTDKTFLNNALYDSSAFLWRFNTYGTSNDGLMQYDGTALSHWPENANYYKDTLVRFNVGDVVSDAANKDTLFVSELNRPSADVTSGCVSPEDTTIIDVIALPTMTDADAADGEDTLGACGASEDTIEYTFTGIPPYYVEFEIEYVTGGGTIVDTAVVNSGEDFLMIYGNDNLAAAKGGAPAGGDEFTVTMTGLWDRISWRALNKNVLVAAGGVKVDPGLDEDLRIFIYPTPNKPSIKHLKTSK